MADTLFKTNLVVVASPLPADFRGTPQEFFEAFVERIDIQSPVGTNFFSVGDSLPATDIGPFLLNGTQWWVWDVAFGEYVPLDISASVANLFTVSATEPPPPGAGDANIWLRTSSGRVIGWYFYTGSAWRPGGNTSPSGTTAQRPTDPADYEQYFDTTINALIHWERGAWRTVSGVPQDVKFVVTATLADALAQNPGWAYLGTLDQSFIGATLGVASKDPGATPVASFTVDSGITERASGDYVGAETHVLSEDEILQHTHLIGNLNALDHSNNFYTFRVDDGETFSAQTSRPPNKARIGTTVVSANFGNQVGELDGSGFPAGTTLVTSKQMAISAGVNYTEASEPHNNMQPTWFLWALFKQ